MQREKRYTKQELFKAFYKKQNDQIRELLALETGVDLFSEKPLEAINLIPEQQSLDLNEGFYDTTKGKQQYKNDDTTFKRGITDNRSNNNKPRFGFGSGNKIQKQEQVGLKEPIKVFEECGIETDKEAKVWYYKSGESLEGPYNSIEMDEMLATGKIWFDTRIVYLDKDGKFLSIKKLISHTYNDKYNDIIATAIQPKQVPQTEVVKRGFFKRENEEPLNNQILAKSVSVEQEQNKPIRGIQKTTSVGEVEKQSNSRNSNQVESNQVQRIETQNEKPVDKSNSNNQTQDQSVQEESQIENGSNQNLPSVEAKNQKSVKVSNPEISEIFVKAPITQEPQDLEGFQTVSGKGNKKKNNKKNQTKMVITGLSEQEQQEEEKRKRQEEIKQRDLQMNQKQGGDKSVSGNNQKKIDIFDEDAKAEKIINEVSSFPTLGGKQPIQKVQSTEKPVATVVVAVPPKTQNEAPKQQVQPQVISSKSKNVDDDEWIVTNKSNKKKQKSKKQEDSDDEFESLQQIAEQQRLERLQKQKELDEKKRQEQALLQAQDEKKRMEFQKRQVFGETNKQQESEDEESQSGLNSANASSFPSLSGSIYTGPSKNSLKPQATSQTKNKQKSNSKSSNQPQPFNYLKTLDEEASWDAPKTNNLKQQNTQQKKSKPDKPAFAQSDFPSL